MVRPTSARCAAIVLSAISALLAGACASGGASSSASGATRRVVLVEAEGSATDVETLVSRLSFESTEAGRFALTDARLAGARLAELGADPSGDRASAFRRQYPGEALLSLSVSPCVVASSSVSQPYTDPSTGLRSERLIVSVRAECTVALTLTGAADGASLLRASVTGQAALRRGTDEEGDSAESEAIRDAARRAAKRIASALPR